MQALLVLAKTEKDFHSVQASVALLLWAGSLWWAWKPCSLIPLGCWCHVFVQAGGAAARPAGADPPG